MWTFERVAGPFGFTEGPVWTGEVVLFTDIPASRIMSYNPRTGACDVFAVDTNNANGLARSHDGGLYVCEGGMHSGEGRCLSLYAASGARRALADRYEGRRLNEPNDVVVDRQGRVLFTDPCYGERAKLELDHLSVYRLDPQPGGDYAIVRVTTDTTCPNGLVFSPDGATLYVAESPRAPHGRRQLRAYPIAADASLGEAVVLYDFGPHRGIDGMRVDAQGSIVATAGWQESGPGPRIVVFSPTGQVLEEHPVAANPTNCCFGDEDLQSLYVTGYDGCLWRARTDRRGLPLPPAGAATPRA
jgi:gluconolactonase